MIERAPIAQQRTNISCRRNPSRCFDNVMICLTLLVYCVAYIEQINGDTFPVSEDSNISSIEQLKLNTANDDGVDVSVNGLQSKQSETGVTDTDVPTTTTTTTTTTTNNTDVERQQSTLSQFLQNNVSAMNSNISAMTSEQDDDYTYDNHVSFGSYENDVSTASSATFEQEDFSALQESQQKAPNTTDAESVSKSVSERSSDDTVPLINAAVNETTSLSNLSTSDVLIAGDNSSLVNDQSFEEEANIEPLTIQADFGDGSVHQKEPPFIEATSATDADSIEKFTNDAIGTTFNLTEELAVALNFDDDNGGSTMIQEQFVTSNQSISEIVDKERTMNDTGTCSSNQNQTHYYCSTIWGDKNVTRRRPSTNLSILEHLFRGVFERSDLTMLTTAVRTPNTTWRDSIANNTDKGRHRQNKGKNDSLDSLQPKNLSDDALTTHHGEIISEDNEDTSVLYDIDDFFQNADITDEFDVSTKDSSIQEVLMGSATRLVVRRCTIAGRFVWNKVRTAQMYIFLRIKNSAETNEMWKKVSNYMINIRELSWMSKFKDGELVFLRWMHNEDGEFAPMRRFRTADGEWIIGQHLKNYDGEILGVSKQQVHDGFKWLHKSTMSVFKQVDKFLDTILSGSITEVDDELEFKFLADKDFLTQSIVPDA